MSKYRGPKLRIIRRFGKLPGLTSKVSKKTKAPGLNGSAIKIRKKTSKYSIRLKEKQKLRFNYGIGEKQLVKYMKTARKRKGPSGKILLSLLEMRLDNIVHRLGFAPTIGSARQMINHGHINVNEKIINIPSFICYPKLSVKAKKNLVSENLVRKNIESIKSLLVPPHLLLNKEKLEGKIINIAHRKVLSLLINELLIVEHYSRKI